MALVVLPQHTIDTRGRLPFQPEERRLQHLGVDQVEERCEPLLLSLSCGLPHVVQPLGHASPALSPVHVLLSRVPLGLPPWLHLLRPRSPGLVRKLPRYYGEVRLLRSVHHRLRLLAFPMRAAWLDNCQRSARRSPGSRVKSVRACQGLRPRRVAWTLAIARPVARPSANSTASAPGKNMFRGSMAGLHAPLSTLRHAPRGP